MHTGCDSYDSPTESDDRTSPRKKNRKRTNHIEHEVEEAKPEGTRIEMSGQRPVQGDEWGDDYNREVEPPDLPVPIRPSDGRQRLSVAKEFVHVFI